MTMHHSAKSARIMGGVPGVNMALYHRIRFAVGDPAAWIETVDAGGRATATLILRDIEVRRARQHARADRVASYEDFAPAGGLSGDRETATAQAAAECVRRAGAGRVIADRTLPLIYAHHLLAAGIAVEYDAEMGVAERRAKDAQELAWLREAQRDTERLMRRMCETIAGAEAGRGGVLMHDGQMLTSERARSLIAVWAMELGYATPMDSIVAGGAVGADCHDHGHGALRTGEPIIVDIFPQNRSTRYHGDCTRTVVHGEASDTVAAMHEAVVEAKASGIAAVRAGVTGQAVHEATIGVIRERGYATGQPPEDAEAAAGVGVPGAGASGGWCGMTHGTGHGIGLEVHEPPLLNFGGPMLVVGDVLTIEPGLYAVGVGGVRVEDMVAVTAAGSERFNALEEGLSWA